MQSKCQHTVGNVHSVLLVELGMGGGMLCPVVEGSGELHNYSYPFETSQWIFHHILLCKFSHIHIQSSCFVLVMINCWYKPLILLTASLPLWHEDFHNVSLDNLVHDQQVSSLPKSSKKLFYSLWVLHDKDFMCRLNRQGKQIISASGAFGGSKLQCWWWVRSYCTFIITTPCL